MTKWGNNKTKQIQDNKTKPGGKKNKRTRHLDKNKKEEQQKQ
jgi:hypothetical protein